jgi:hypothetical protein
MECLVRKGLTGAVETWESHLTHPKHSFASLFKLGPIKRLIILSSPGKSQFSEFPRFATVSVALHELIFSSAFLDYFIRNPKIAFSAVGLDGRVRIDKGKLCLVLDKTQYQCFGITGQQLAKTDFRIVELDLAAPFFIPEKPYFQRWSDCLERFSKELGPIQVTLCAFDIESKKGIEFDSQKFPESSKLCVYEAKRTDVSIPNVPIPNLCHRLSQDSEEQGYFLNWSAFLSLSPFGLANCNLLSSCGSERTCDLVVTRVDGCFVPEFVEYLYSVVMSLSREWFFVSSLPLYLQTEVASSFSVLFRKDSSYLSFFCT